MIGLAPSLVTGLLAISLHFSTALAICDSSVSIRSAEYARDLGKLCPVLLGNVYIGPFDDNTTIQHLDFEGLVKIEGYLWEDRRAQNQAPFTISSSTLRSVRGVSFGTTIDISNLQSLSLPNLTYVEKSFTLGSSATNITHLDITNLETVSDLELAAPNLRKLQHKGLYNADSIDIRSMKLSTLDNLTGLPLNVSYISIWGDFPTVETIPIGCKYAKRVSISSNSSVTLGGPRTSEMRIGSLVLNNDVPDLKYAPKLKYLEVDTLDVREYAAISHLDLQFDNLRYLKVHGSSLYTSNPHLKDIKLTPKAVNWTGGFEIRLWATNDVNLTSMYREDEQGNNVQTWYWPTNVSHVYIDGANLGNPFFDEFVSRQKVPLDSVPPPSNLSMFGVYPSKNTTNFTCAPFKELQEMGRLPGTRHFFGCHNSTDINGANSLHMPSLSIFAGAVLGAMWML